MEATKLTVYMTNTRTSQIKQSQVSKITFLIHKTAFMNVNRSTYSKADLLCNTGNVHL